MRPRFARIGMAIALGVVLAAGCGGSDAAPGEGSGDDATEQAADPTDGVTDRSATDADRDATGATAPPGGTNDRDATDGTGRTAPTGDEVPSGAVDCDGLFPLAEIEAWFGEPAQLTEVFTESLGQTVCTWETIDDPEDADDLAFQLIVAQIFSGDPIPAANFVDPDIYDDPVMLDDLGDLAFYGDSLGTDFNFVDEPWAGSFTYSDVDMGDVDAEKRHTFDEVEAMFRRFHARVTAG